MNTISNLRKNDCAHSYPRLHNCPDLNSHSFSKTEKETIHRVIRGRRDIRHFRSTPISKNILFRILRAGHWAPSVGFMQPWNFIIISSKTTRRKIKQSFEKVNTKEMEKIDHKERKILYRQLKLEGILEAPINVAVTCDHCRDAPFVLGRAPMPNTDLFSVCLAIENMWLAARAEGIGMGWVSLLDHSLVGKILDLPKNVELVAYLCMGYPLEFRPIPMLEEVGWKSRVPLENVVFQETWGRSFKMDKKKNGI